MSIPFRGARVPHSHSRSVASWLRPLAWLRARPRLSVALVFALPIFERHLVPANTDISWLLTVGERVLGGEALYRDVLETNPPIAVLAYLPALLIGRVLHVAPETVVDALVFCAIALSLGLAARILQGASVSRTIAVPGNRWLLAIFTLIVLAILPMRQFGQREHIALLTLLPLLALWAVRADGETPARWAIVVAGLGAGLTLAFKPHFICAVALAAVALAIHGRSWRKLFVAENIIAAALMLGYAGYVAAFHPAYFTVIGPLVRDVYLPVGLSPGAMLIKPAMLLWAALVVSVLLFDRRERLDAPVWLLLAASSGFALAYLLQRKGWPYHSYPMIALAMIAVAVTLARYRVESAADRPRGLNLSARLAVLFVAALVWFNAGLSSGALQERVARLGPNPTMLAISAEFSLGHPLVRALHGTWASRQQGLWVAQNVAYLEQTGALDARRKAALQAYAAHERAMLIEDIKTHRPDVVLVDRANDDWQVWLEAHPDVAVLLKDYRQVETVDGIAILRR